MAIKSVVTYEDSRGKLHKIKSHAELAEAEYKLDEMLEVDFDMITPATRARFISKLNQEKILIMQRYIKVYKNVFNGTTVEEV